MKRNYLIIFIIIAVFLLMFSVYAFFFFRESDFFKNFKNGDRSLANVLQSKKLIVGTYPEFSPLTFKDEDGKNIGYDIDLINEIAKKMKVTVEIKEMNFPDLFPAVKEKSVDVAISSITITPERSETVLFGIPYFTSGQIIITREDYDDIKKPEDFVGRKIAAIRDTTCEIAIKDYLEEPYEEFVSFETFTEEIEALKNGEVDAVVHDYTVAAYVANLDPEIKIVGNPFTQEYYGIMSNIENKSLIEKIDEIVRDFKRDGSLKKIDDKWFGR